MVEDGFHIVIPGWTLKLGMNVAYPSSAQVFSYHRLAKLIYTNFAKVSPVWPPSPDARNDLGVYLNVWQ